MAWKQRLKRFCLSSPVLISRQTLSFLLCTVKKNSDDRSDSIDSTIPIVGILVGVLGTLAIGLTVAVIVISRRRKSSGNGLFLIVSEET